MASDVHEPSRAQAAVARRSAESRATVPDLTLGLEVALGEEAAALDALAWRARAVRAYGRALARHPRANGAYRDAEWALRDRVGIGVATPLQDAFAHPVVAVDDATSADEVAEALRALQAKAGEGALTRPDLSGATATLTDAGPAGVTDVTPVIVPPHATALGVGAVRAAPVVRDGAVVAGHVVRLTLACDHRILFGSAAAEFLADVGRELTAPY